MARNAVKVELVSARRSQIGDSYFAGSAIQGQHLGLPLCIFVLDHKRIKCSSRDNPGETDRVAGDLGNREIS